jgi:excisionase family DNA binding protein
MTIIDGKYSGRTTFRVEEAAEILSLSIWAAYEGIKLKQIPAVRIGRRLVVPRVALERLLLGEQIVA